jgi:hypothetical protein
METLPILIRKDDVVFDRNDLAFARIYRDQKKAVQKVVLHLKSAGELKLEGPPAVAIAEVIYAEIPNWDGTANTVTPIPTKTKKK